MKKFFLFLLFAVLSLVTFAQDTTSTGGTGGNLNLPGSVTLWIGVLVGVYELLVRYFPTISSYSIVTWIIRVFKSLSPDNSAKGGTHE